MRTRCLYSSPGQDVEPAEDSDVTDGRWRIARKVAADRMISTVDPDTRHAHKTRSRQQDGFKAHIVIEPDTGLITAAELTKASGPGNSDGAVGARLIGMDPTIAGTSVDVLADSAYGSGEMLATLARTAHTPTNTTPCWANTATAPRTRPSKMTTARTGPWSSGPSPGSPAATAAFRTAASNGTTPGCNCGSRD